LFLHVIVFHSIFQEQVRTERMVTLLLQRVSDDRLRNYKRLSDELKSMRTSVNAVGVLSSILFGFLDGVLLS
jgi:hypothetical protein